VLYVVFSAARTDNQIALVYPGAGCKSPTGTRWEKEEMVAVDLVPFRRDRKLKKTAAPNPGAWGRHPGQVLTLTWFPGF
jgi:hypothetical protein